MMKERTMDALKKAEEFFVEVIEEEHDGKATMSRTENICCAVKGLKSIAFIKHKMDKHNGDTKSVSMPMTNSYK